MRPPRAIEVAALSGVLALAACSGPGNRPAPEVRPRPSATTEAPRSGPSEIAEGAAGDSSTATDPAGVTPPPTAGAAAPPQVVPSAPQPPIVARVSDTTIGLSALLATWIRRDGNAVRDLLDGLVLSRIVELEAERLGATLPTGLLERTLAGRLERLRDEARRAGAPSLRAFVESRLGLSFEAFEDGLRGETRTDLLASRVVRAWLLASERAELRVIAVASNEARDQVEAKLTSGQPFEEVARELSEDGSAEDGGRLAPVVRGESAMARRAFSAPVGEVVGPFVEAGRTLFLSVDGRPAPLRGDWASVGGEVEASLGERGIEDPEYWQWQQAMDAAYDIDLAPFAELIEGQRPE